MRACDRYDVTCKTKKYKLLEKKPRDREKMSLGV